MSYSHLGLYYNTSPPICQPPPPIFTDQESLSPKPLTRPPDIPYTKRVNNRGPLMSYKQFPLPLPTQKREAVIELLRFADNLDPKDLKRKTDKQLIDLYHG